MNTQRLLTAQEVADQVRVHVVTFYRWCREGKGPKVTRLSPKVERYAISDVVDWLETRRTEQKTCA